jgi:methylthioribose-1-phosphate isomerase
MTTLITKLYEVITEYQGDTLANYIGVIEGGWDDQIIDTATDSRVFYFMDQDEFDALTVGTDITGDGDVVTDIEREPSYIFEETVDGDR